MIWGFFIPLKFRVEVPGLWIHCFPVEFSAEVPGIWVYFIPLKFRFQGFWFILPQWNFVLRFQDFGFILFYWNLELRFSGFWLYFIPLEFCADSSQTCSKLQTQLIFHPPVSLNHPKLTNPNFSAQSLISYLRALSHCPTARKSGAGVCCPGCSRRVWCLFLHPGTLPALDGKE